MNITTIKLRHIGLGLAAIVSMLVIQLIVSSSTFAAVKTWDGGGGDDNFSTGANWDADTAPVSGDSLVFPTVGGGPFVMTNDLNGTDTYVGVSVTGSTNYSVDSITLTTGTVEVTSTGTFEVTAGLASSGAMTLDGNNNLLTIGALTVGGDLTVLNPFTATSADIATTIVSMATDFTVTGTLQVDGSLTLSQDITVGALSVGANLSVTAANFQVTNGTTVGGNLTMSGTPAITTAGPINVTGDATISSTFVGTPAINVGNDLTVTTAFTSGAIDVNGDLTASAAFTAGAIDVTGSATINADITATSLSAGSIVVGSSFDGGAITSYASLTTGAFTITATTLTFPNGSTLTVSSGGTVDAATSITIGNDSADTGAQIVAGAGSTIDTPTITVHGNTGSASSIGGTLTAASNISLPNGSLTLSTASTVGTVTVANALTASNFTATSVMTDTLTISGVFTVTGTLDVNSTSTPLTIGSAIVVGTLDVADDLTVSTGFTANTAVIVAGNLTASAVITGVETVDVGGDATLNSTFSGSPAPAIDVTGTLTVGANFTAASVTANAVTMNSVFTVTGTLSVTTALTVTRAISVGTLTALGGLTISNSFTAPIINVTGNVVATTAFITTTLTASGNFTSSADFTATTVNVTGNVIITGYHYAGHVYLVGGTLTLGNGTSGGNAYFDDGTDVTGLVTVELYNTLYQDNAAVVDFGSLLVKNGATVRLYGDISYPVTFGSGKSTASPVIGYNSSSTTVDGDGNTVYNTLKFTGAATLANDVILQIYGNAASGAVEFAGTLAYNGFSILKTATTEGKLIVAGVEVRNPAVTNEYDGNMPTTSLSVGDNEVAIITGTRDTVSAYRGGFIKGTGRIVNLNLNFGSTLSPGNSPGTLTILENLYFEEGATYYAELQSTSAYDKLAVGEEFIGSGSPVDLNDATLSVVLSEGFSIAQGDKFTIIDNKSDEDITTTFNNLDEGTVFSVADGTFSISYVGGDGNDVVLTVVSAPTAPVQAPNTGFRVLANPAVVLGLGIITAGFFLVMATRRQVQTNRY